jgi:hypothetical protein
MVYDSPESASLIQHFIQVSAGTCAGIIPACWILGILDSKKSVQTFKVCKLSTQAYGVDLSDIEGTPQDYRTLNAFFSRRLRPDARPIHQPG